MTTVKLPVATIATFLWIGFVCAISFMEAWLKFRAPGVTVELGLGIGRIVFSALNKVECVLAAAILLNLFFSDVRMLSTANLAYYLPLVLLMIQTSWLLPALDARAALQVQGMAVPSSGLHGYYIGMEIIKVISLAVFGITLFSTKTIIS